MNYGLTIPLTIRHGEWLTSIAGLDTVSLVISCNFWLAIPSISMPMMEVLDMSYGLTIFLTILHGEWLTSIVGQETVLLDNTRNFWLATLYISLLMMEVLELNCGRTTPLTIRHGELLTSTTVREVVSLDNTWNFSLATPSISQPMIQALEMGTVNCGLMTPLTTRHGEWLISIVGQQTVILDNTCNFLLETPSISMLMMEVLELNCGLTAFPTTPHGELLTSTVGQRAVNPEEECTISLTTLSISQPTMEALGLCCGHTAHLASITTRIRAEPLSRGPLTPACRVVSRLERTTVRFTAHRPNCGHKPPTWSGRTTAEAQAWLTSTSPWLTSCQPFHTRPRIWLTNNTASSDLPLAPIITGLEQSHPGTEQYPLTNWNVI